jgi:Mrp family chromosome partitioning ATPase
MASGTKRFGAPAGPQPPRDGFDEPTRAAPHTVRREPTAPAARSEQTAITRVAMPQESFLPEGTSSQTVMMQAMRPNLPAHMKQAVDPPEISITEHQLERLPVEERLVLVREPDSERAASFRVLRHHLLERGRPQVVVVSSPNKGEGKTTTAVNLALALSECDRARVLLVEATVRRPQLAAIFRFVPPWCYAEQLAAHRYQPLLPWSLVHIPSMSLHVAAINPRVEQSQLLDAPAFGIAMERLRLGGFDHIVIDAPAVLGSADVNLIQDAADGVLLTAKARSTTARDLRRASDQLRPTKLLGTVLLH